ncbi:LeuD/DmdB family oxidoreductase small subunit [Caldiplasma sukawensis]
MNSGKAIVLGDDIDTDVIAPGPYLHMGIEEILRHSFEAISKDFYKKVSPGDVLFAGENFGCGSSREQAVIVIKEMGIGAIVAKSYSRLFFRNAINNGLYVLESNQIEGVKDGHVIRYSFEDQIMVFDENLKKNLNVKKIDGPPLEILRAGGLLNFGKIKKF